MSEPPRIFDYDQLRRLRERASVTASSHDFLLRRVADDFAERLDAIKRQFETVLDFGAHHGVIGRRLSGRSGTKSVISTDSSAAMLAQCAPPRVLAEPETLPFADGAFDLAVSGLSLQLVNDIPGVLLQIRRILKPDGLFLGAMLGGATLHELREAFVVAESEIEGGISPRVAPFADVRDLGSLLQRAGFALPVVDSDVVTVAYASPLHLMRELRAMGASNMLVERRRKPLKRATLMRACEIYAQRFARGDGRVTATFEIITLTGWCPHESQQKPLRPGSATSRLADALGVPEHAAGDKTGPSKK
jgi:NADH dehydrogenase [ubiquinone] 1 alpha subcomplex assembly factor 5